MDNTEARWAKAVGLKKTNYRIRSNGREQIVYIDKSGSLYYIKNGKYVGITHEDYYDPDDLIRRADAIKAIRDAECRGEWHFRLCDGMEVAVDIINELPSAER